MATRGADVVVSGGSEAVGSEGSGEDAERTGPDEGMGSTMSAFVSFRSDFGSAKLCFCRFPGKHIPRIFV
jgi:hypothetical protein